jgi:hypothetical protein
MRDFAEAEIVLPDSGPHGGDRFKCSYQPYSGLWFDAIGSGLFRRHVATGPSQSGKSLSALVIPLLYHLFERRDTCVLFAPEMDICEDKYLVDILPVLQRSRFADLLPRRGPGSQGAFAELITFRNGARLKCMSAGGGDSAKGAFTAKAAFGTEIDAMDDAKESSDESDPISQILARLRAHKDRREYLECTVTLPGGRIWTEYQSGTCSRIVQRCVHCDHWVTPEREHFVGWQSAGSELQAEQLGRFSCPDCGGFWTPEQRKAADRDAKLIHRGQEVTPDGQVIGPMPETRTLSMRWSAANNHFTDESQLAAEEFIAERQLDQVNAQKARCQQVWCIPWTGEVDAVDVTPELVASRLSKLPRGTLPNDVETLVVQIDVHDRWLYWVAVATSPLSVYSVVGYGIHANPNPEVLGPQEAIRRGLEELTGNLLLREWKTLNGQFALDLCMVDGGYRQEIGLQVVTMRGSKFRLSKGKGDYKRPTPDNNTLVRDHWFDSRQAACSESSHRQWWMAITDTSFWLHQVRAGFAALSFMEDGITRRPGSIAMFGEVADTHLTPVDKTINRSAFAVQLTAWKWQQIQTKKRGQVFEWTSQFAEDHFFDCTYGCLVADRVVRTYAKRFRAPAAPVVEQPRQAMTTPDGRPFVASQIFN